MLGSNHYGLVDNRVGEASWIEDETHLQINTLKSEECVQAWKELFKAGEKSQFDMADEYRSLILILSMETCLLGQYQEDRKTIALCRCRDSKALMILFTTDLIKTGYFIRFVPTAWWAKIPSNHIYIFSLFASPPKHIFECTVLNFMNACFECIFWCFAENTNSPSYCFT